MHRADQSRPRCRQTLGGRIPRCSTDGFARKAVQHIPESLQPALEPVLESITQLSRQIRFFDKQIQELCEERHPETDVGEEPRDGKPSQTIGWVSSDQTLRASQKAPEHRTPRAHDRARGAE